MNRKELDLVAVALDAAKNGDHTEAIWLLDTIDGVEWAYDEDFGYQWGYK